MKVTFYSNNGESFEGVAKFAVYDIAVNSNRTIHILNVAFARAGVSKSYESMIPKQVQLRAVKILQLPNKLAVK